MICLIRCDVPTFFFTSKFLLFLGRGVLLFFLSFGLIGFLLGGIVVVIVVVVIVVVVIVVVVVVVVIVVVIVVVVVVVVVGTTAICVVVEARLRQRCEILNIEYALRTR